MVQIKKASLESMPAVARVLRTSFRDTYATFPELHTDDEDREFFTNVVFPKNEIYIAEDTSGTIVGFIAFNDEFIDHLYLLPDRKRQGIGSELIQLALKHSAHLKLWTFQENTAAIAFYKKHGFSVILETDGAGNEEQQPDVLLERRL